MEISEWTRYDNLPFGIGEEFSHIREEAELLGDVEEWEVENHTREQLEKEFPQLFKDFRFEDVVEIEYYPFERDCDMKADEFPGYAVYIHMQRDLVVKMVEHVKDKHPDYVLSYLHWMSQPLEKA